MIIESIMHNRSGAKSGQSGHLQEESNQFELLVS
jgi:hypothetical protein